MDFIRTTSENQDFQILVKQLDDFLAARDGEDHAFYAQYNGIDAIRNVVLCYDGVVPVACGAFKVFDKDTVEIKRMFVLPEYRGRGVAFELLGHLEKWAAESGYNTIILETVVAPNEAIGLYLKAGYSIIPNFGQYVDAPKSLCMKKVVQVVS